MPNHQPGTNGVHVARLKKTIRALQKQPVLAEFRFRATNKWISGGHNRTQVQNFYGVCQEGRREKPFRLDADEPPVLLGQDKGPNPVEYVLTALASCMTTTLVYKAALHGVRVDEVESRLEGEIDLQGLLETDRRVRNGYRNVSITFRVKSDASAEQLETWAKGSPVFDVVSNPVPVHLRIEKMDEIAGNTAAAA
ncbi:MAG TPA: OsmC family protein [Chthoniobacterales bacterium]|nr:OsmC family protein [Chthoniobacterales bacterium]